MIYTKEKIEQIKDFLILGKLPKGIASPTAYKWQKKYKDGTWTIEDKVLLHGGKAIIPIENLQEFLDFTYKSPTFFRVFYKILQSFED